MGQIQKMVDYAVSVAKDDKHGYSQVRRWPKQGTDFDCATLMYESAHKAGYDVGEGPDKTRYTGTMLADFKKAGFTAVPFDGNLSDLTPGDILLNVVHHTEMYIGDGKFVGAHIAETGDVDGKPGDQTGNEISVCKAYIPEFGWDYVLVPPKETAAKPTAKAKSKTPAKTTVKKRLNGIDISSHQSENGIQVAKLQADFVIVKVSGGTSYVNDRAHDAARDWREIADEVLKSKKLLGLYHYACECDTEPGGKAEAQFFLKQIKGYEGKAVLCLDWEAHAQQMPVTYAKAWLDTVAKATGSTPMFYAYASYLNSRDHSLIRRYPLWMASYLYKYENGTGYISNPDNTWPTSSWPKMTMYQYASTRKLKGYSATLDMDVFYGTADDWKSLAKSGTPQPAVVVTQPRYRVWRDGAWQAWHSNGASAGKSKHPVYDIDFSGLPTGSWWRLTLKGGKVLGKNRHNDAHKLPVAGVEVYYKTADPEATGYHEAVYRVHTVAGKWLKWEHDVDDGGAGDDVNVIDVFQMKIAEC